MSSHSNFTDAVDSPTEWVAEHIKTYVESGGAQGHTWHNGTPTLLLSVLGRKTGTWRRTALIYGRSGEDYVVVASKAGAPNHPMWFLNLRDHPEVGVQVGPEVFPARARIAEGAERERLWNEMTLIWPDYAEYQKKTQRQIPVVVLERVAESSAAEES